MFQPLRLLVQLIFLVRNAAVNLQLHKSALKLLQISKELLELLQHKLFQHGFPDIVDGSSFHTAVALVAAVAEVLDCQL